MLPVRILDSRVVALDPDILHELSREAAFANSSCGSRRISNFEERVEGCNRGFVFGCGHMDKGMGVALGTYQHRVQQCGTLSYSTKRQSPVSTRSILHHYETTASILSWGQRGPEEDQKKVRWMVAYLGCVLILHVHQDSNVSLLQPMPSLHNLNTPARRMSRRTQEHTQSTGAN